MVSRNKNRELYSMWIGALILSVGLLAAVSGFAKTTTDVMAHPKLVVSTADVAAMQLELKKSGRFTQAYFHKKKAIDAQLKKAIAVPVPKDAGGGYTHETHKNNAQIMYDAAMLFQLSGEKKYAERVRDLLLAYAQLYPTLPLHPERKTDSVISAGRLFWQNLNESVWLVYTIQAYDAVMPALTAAERNTIEAGLFRPIATFLSEGSPDTFNKIHNHATWATCAVGMTGYVINEPEWVEKALLGLDKSGKGGFLQQLEQLFSPQGYYNEGPYYQRYALLPFVTFAKAIEVNDPQRKIFTYRDSIILKAINTTIQLSYNKLFFPINDVIKDKGIDTIELVNGVAIAYGITGDTGLLSIAQQQNNILLTGDGLKVAQALDKNLQSPYAFKSMAFGDGAAGNEGALVVMREQEQALVYKATAQGMGHGHFDKLGWLFFDKGEEIVADYGAARFLNVEAKFGGRYLPENKTYANQTIAHNALVVDETSHFDGDTEVGNANHPELLYFEQDKQVKISAARMNKAYKDVEFVRTMAQINLPILNQPIVIDVLNVVGKAEHQLDLPVHYKGHLVDTNFALNTALTTISALGKAHGYQHLWLKARATPAAGLAQVTWLNDNGRFYTLSSLVKGATEVLFTQIGANDPSFNLRTENAFIFRVAKAKAHDFVSVMEPHGEYNAVSEFTVKGDSQIKKLEFERQAEVQLVAMEFSAGVELLLAFTNEQKSTKKSISRFTYKGVDYTFNGHFKLIELNNK
jgi:oligo-alginate lyase